MLVKEMRERLRNYRREDIVPVSKMKKEDVAKELEKYEKIKNVRVEVKVEEKTSNEKENNDVKVDVEKKPKKEPKKPKS